MKSHRWRVSFGLVSGVAGVTALTAVLGLPAGAGCNADVFDVQVDLAARTYRADFGAQTGTIPTAPCDPAAPQACAAGATTIDATTPSGIPADVDISWGCDDATQACYAEATARLAMPVNVLDDEAFTTKVQRQAISLVRVADVGYTVPVNTLTFALPSVDLYAGPEGSRAETDPGVAYVGSTAPIPAGTVVDSMQHIVVTDGTPARPLIEDAIRDQRTFVLIAVIAPRLVSGDPIPAGAIQIDVFPHVVVGLPR